MISCRKWEVYLIRQKRCLAWPCQAIEVNCDVRRMKRDIIIKPNFRYRTDMRLSSLCRDRFNQIKPLSQSRVIWNLNFKSHTWTHFCFKVQTRSAKAEPNESFLRVHERRFSGAVSSLPNILQYWKMSSRLVFLEGCCAVWREIKWCLTSSSFYYFFRKLKWESYRLKASENIGKIFDSCLSKKIK